MVRQRNRSTPPEALHGRSGELKITQARPCVVAFLMPPNFALLSYACALEALRAANTLAQRTLYTWRHVTFDGKAARSLTGQWIDADHRVGEEVSCDILIVGSPANFLDAPESFDKASCAWLRKLARNGVCIVGIGGGLYLMARSGLLDHRRCAIHWTLQPGFLEEFPQVRVEQTLYVMDGKLITSAGGTAPLDLMNAIISAQHGPELALAVRDWFVQGEVRIESDLQRISLPDRLGVTNSAVLQAVTAMEQHTEDPLSRAEIAAAAGISVRQLERLFRNVMSTSIANYYTDLRLRHAQTLLQQTGRPVTEVSVASGFSSLSYFSRAYKKRFGYSPASERTRAREHD